MIRWEFFKQLNKFTYALETYFSYSLETDEEDGIGLLDEAESSSIVWLSSHVMETDEEDGTG